MHAQYLKAKRIKAAPSPGEGPAIREEEGAAELEMFGTEL
jgi:hypothetical protein